MSRIMSHRVYIMMGCFVSLAAQFAIAQPASAPAMHHELVLQDEPVAYWRFNRAGKSIQPNAIGSTLEAHIVGKVGVAQDGPRPKQYPSFAIDNEAIRFGVAGAYLRVKDPGAKSPLDFTAGDAITLEAWVAPEQFAEGQQVYIVGKGRTRRKGFPPENQNYALRLRNEGGTARISFLFRRANKPGSSGYHRWNSNVGFIPGDGWHHVALTYKFGDAKSIRGYLDGQAVNGTWDMGGPTNDGPVVDDDELWIGSSIGGNPSSTFRGLIDDVAIYRKVISAERMQLRFKVQPAKPLVADADLPKGQVLVEIIEGVPNQRSWNFRMPNAIESFPQPAFAFVEVPRKYSKRGIQLDRTTPFVVRAIGLIDLPKGPCRILLRSRDAARLYIDGKLIAQNPFFNISGTAHGRIRKVAKIKSGGIRKLQTGDSENVFEFVSPRKQHRIRLEFFVGGQKRRPELGETSLCIQMPNGEFHVLSQQVAVPLTDDGWIPFARTMRATIASINAERRRLATNADDYWQRRHAYARKVVAESAASKDIPPRDTAIDHFIKQAAGAEFQPTALVKDWVFLRRVTVDVIGIPPSRQMIQQFFADSSLDRRKHYIDRLLANPLWADNWMGYWQDVLAENPNIVNPTLNNTGPFRWWIHESLLDNKPFDRFVTELIRMEGSRFYGGPAGFSVASQNDAPLAAKAHIIGQAFLGVQMKCARCHDAPFHDVGQRDLFAIAAMLHRSPQVVPKTSTVPGGSLSGPDSLVKVTVKPGEKIDSVWPFESLVRRDALNGDLVRVDDTRERLAGLVTSPHNNRFAQVAVNRLWKRYIGRGLVEPVDDWEHADTQYEDLLEFLSREFLTSGYDLKHIARLILNSEAYQREPAVNSAADSETFDFAGPLRRRMTAEQIVDSLFAICGKDFHAGVMNIDADGARNFDKSLNLGIPTHAWQFMSLSNERDRPSLSLPLAQDFVSTLTSFDWRGSRQNPRTDRDDTPSVFQPASLANGVLGRRFTRLSEDSAFTALACQDIGLTALIEQTYERVLTRPPTNAERELFMELLRPGFTNRIRAVNRQDIHIHRPQSTGVSWSNHLSPESNQAQIDLARKVAAGDPPSIRLETDWRERMEDMLWSLLNSPEFVFRP